MKVARRGLGTYRLSGRGIAAAGTMWKTPIGKLRAIGMVEGISFLVLLGIAMPLKYLAGRPEAVTVVGWAHGILFMIFCLVLLQTMLAMRWPLSRAALAFAAALVPFGPFLIDGRLRREDEARRRAGEPGSDGAAGPADSPA